MSHYVLRPFLYFPFQGTPPLRPHTPESSSRLYTSRPNPLTYGTPSPLDPLFGSDSFLGPSGFGHSVVTTPPFYLEFTSLPSTYSSFRPHGDTSGSGSTRYSTWKSKFDTEKGQTRKVQMGVRDRRRSVKKGGLTDRSRGWTDVEWPRNVTLSFYF